jgi:hypothetical protein
MGGPWRSRRRGAAVERAGAVQDAVPDAVVVEDRRPGDGGDQAIRLRLREGDPGDDVVAGAFLGVGVAIAGIAMIFMSWPKALALGGYFYVGAGLILFEFVFEPMIEWCRPSVMTVSNSQLQVRMGFGRRKTYHRHEIGSVVLKQRSLTVTSRGGSRHLVAMRLGRGVQKVRAALEYYGWIEREPEPTVE